MIPSPAMPGNVKVVVVESFPHLVGLSAGKVENMDPIRAESVARVHRMDESDHAGVREAIEVARRDPDFDMDFLSDLEAAIGASHEEFNARPLATRIAAGMAHTAVVGTIEGLKMSGLLEKAGSGMPASFREAVDAREAAIRDEPGMDVTGLDMDDETHRTVTRMLGIAGRSGKYPDSTLDGMREVVGSSPADYNARPLAEKLAVHALSEVIVADRVAGRISGAAPSDCLCPNCSRFRDN